MEISETAVLKFNVDDLRLLQEVIHADLEAGEKTDSQRERRVHLYRLLRRLGRARMRLLDERKGQ